FAAMQTTWTGTATDLLDLLGRIVGEKATKAKTWPADATRLGGKLRRAATFLRKVGIEISIGEREGRRRTRNITITSFSEHCEEGNSASAASAASAANDSNDLARTLANDADGQRPRADADGSGGSTSVRTNPLKNNGKDAADARDAELHTLAG